MLDREELDRLPLREKIERLIRLEEERKKDADEARKLRDAYEEELTREEMLSNVKVPEIEPIDISKLFISERGIEANVEVEQEKYEDFNLQYVNVLEGLSEHGFIEGLGEITEVAYDHRGHGAGRVNKLDESINPERYVSTSKKAAERSTASTGVAEEIRKYTAG